MKFCPCGCHANRGQFYRDDNYWHTDYCAHWRDKDNNLVGWRLTVEQFNVYEGA